MLHPGAFSRGVSRYCCTAKTGGAPRPQSNTDRTRCPAGSMVWSVCVARVPGVLRLKTRARSAARCSRAAGRALAKLKGARRKKSHRHGSSGLGQAFSAEYLLSGRAPFCVFLSGPWVSRTRLTVAAGGSTKLVSLFFALEPSGPVVQFRTWRGYVSAPVIHAVYLLRSMHGQHI